MKYRLNKFPRGTLTLDNYSKFITVLVAGIQCFCQVVESLHTIWIKIDESLPWIELKGTYETRKDAKKAAKNRISRAQVKIVAISQTRSS